MESRDTAEAASLRSTRALLPACSPAQVAFFILVGWLSLAIAGAHAQTAEKAPEAAELPPPSIATSLPDNGDPGGHRQRLGERGITYSLMYTYDALANVQGGTKRGTIDQGKLEGTLLVDLEKIAGWQGLTFFTNGFWLHNSGRIRRDYVGGINTIAAIEAVPTWRLSELWLESKLDATTSVRFGQLAADVEFFFAGKSALFLQSDWATITALNLPSGGPAYPLSTPGVRLKFDPSPDTSLLIAAFNGDPAGPGDGDEQIRNHHGLNFRVRDPALVMAEAQLRANQSKDDTGLARIWKLGAWGHFGNFKDQRLALDGTLLADPAGSGIAHLRHGNSGVYAVFEQQLWRPQGGDAESGISYFGRIAASPGDRNPIDFYLDGGLVFANMVSGRPDDKFGASFIYARFSEGARAFDRDLRDLVNAAVPIRDFEANLELTYSAQVVPGWTFQPVATFIWHPNGDASRDAVVVGARTFLRY